MIRCDKCRSLHPQGTLYCGRCGGSLGCRVCDHGHENPLQSHYCQLCGSKKLSNGVPATNYRLRLRVALILLGLGLLTLSVPPVIDAVSAIHVPSVSFDGVVHLIFVVTLAALILGGKKGRKAVFKFYGGLLKFLVRAVIEVIKSLTSPGGSHH